MTNTTLQDLIEQDKANRESLAADLLLRALTGYPVTQEEIKGLAKKCIKIKVTDND